MLILGIDDHGLTLDNGSLTVKAPNNMDLLEIQNYSNENCFETFS